MWLTYDNNIINYHKSSVDKATMELIIINYSRHIQFCIEKNMLTAAEIHDVIELLIHAHEKPHTQIRYNKMVKDAS